MKLTAIIAACLVLATVAAAQERSTPQARPRLDAAGRATASAPAPRTDVTAGPEPALMLEKVIVKEQPLERRAPEEPTPAKGPFTVSDGGTVLQHDIGRVRATLGMSPYVDPMANDARFKPQATSVRYSLLSLAW